MLLLVARSVTLLLIKSVMEKRTVLMEKMKRDVLKNVKTKYSR